MYRHVFSCYFFFQLYYLSNLLLGQRQVTGKRLLCHRSNSFLFRLWIKSTHLLFVIFLSCITIRPFRLFVLFESGLITVFSVLLSSTPVLCDINHLKHIVECWQAFRLDNFSRTGAVGNNPSNWFMLLGKLSTLSLVLKCQKVNNFHKSRSALVDLISQCKTD